MFVFSRKPHTIPSLRTIQNLSSIHLIATNKKEQIEKQRTRSTLPSPSPLPPSRVTAKLCIHYLYLPLVWHFGPLVFVLNKFWWTVDLYILPSETTTSTIRIHFYIPSSWHQHHQKRLLVNMQKQLIW